MTTYLPLSGLFIISGVALVGSGVFMFFRQRAKIRRSLPAVGVVIELMRHRAEGEYAREKTAAGVKIKSKYLYRPVVRFKTETGRTIRFVASVASRPMPYQVGEQVAVIYNPDNPQEAQINRFLYLWFYVVMLIFFGVFTLAMGLLGLMMSDFW